MIGIDADLINFKFFMHLKLENIFSNDSRAAATLVS
jgi:hypothetical protein